MKNSWIALLGLVLAAPVMAQDAPAPSDNPPPAEAPPADSSQSTPPADTSAPPPADQSAPPADSSQSTPPADASQSPPPAETASAPAEAPAEQTPKEPWKLYAGADYARTTISSTGAGTLGIADYKSKMLRARVGRRVLDAVAVEFQYGLDLSDYDKGEASTDRYYGLFIVPTATVFEVVELAVPVGYAKTEATLGKIRADMHSVAFGFNAELPLRAFGDDMPNVRLTSGWMVYNQDAEARIYGLNFGLRYDFEMEGPSMGNPFSGLGHWYKTHMPGWLGGGESSGSSS